MHHTNFSSSNSPISLAQPHDATSRNEGKLVECLVTLGVGVLDALADYGKRKDTILDLNHSTSEWTKYNLWSSLAGMEVVNSIWDVWDSAQDIRIGHDHTRVVQFLSNNTSRSLPDTVDVQSWRRSFSGTNMRWETLGLYLTYLAYRTFALGGIDGSPAASQSQIRSSMLKLATNSRACIAICHGLSCDSSLLVYLMIKHAFLESILEGDTSSDKWRKHGEIAATAVMIGLHSITNSRITIDLEWKRRVWTRVFVTNQTMSSFMNRPPTLFNRFNTTSVPLDLDDADLMADASALLTAVSNLDEHGWNRDGRIHGFTLERARALLAMVNNETLELKFSNTVPVDFAIRVHNLRHSLKDHETRLPTSLRWNESDLTDDNVSYTDISARMWHRLEILRAHYILEELVYHHGGSNLQTLSDLSHTILRMVLILFKYQRRFRAIRSDFEWLIVLHAIPASSTLCSILNYSILDSPFVVLPRTEVLQDLSVFTAFLDWIKPEAPNAATCHTARENIRQTIEATLNGGS